MPPRTLNVNDSSKCQPTLTECPRCHNDIRKCDGLFELHADVAGIVKKLHDLIPFGDAVAEIAADIESLAGQVAEAKGKAGWLAQLVIDKLGGTPDHNGWVFKSAAYYRETVARADRAEAQLAAQSEEIKALRGMAEAMAVRLDAWARIDGCKCKEVDAYRAAYPKEPT